MKKLKSIDCDLSQFKITLQFRDNSDPLVVHFDTPSRRFHFSVIALIVHEMKKKGRPDFIYIRRYRDVLQRLDQGLSGKHASKNAESMWVKINMAWRHRLPELESGAVFKILDRELIPPYEKGGKYRYECTDAECDTWACLFGYDENNKWRFKFAGEPAVVDFNAVSLSYGKLKDDAAWNAYLDRLSVETRSDITPQKEVPTTRQKWVPVLAAVFIVLALTFSTWHFLIRQTPHKEGLELPDRPSIAVLPFANMSEDPKQEYLSDGITEQIITTLSKVRQLFVISRTSTFAYKNKPVKVQQVSEELGVRYVLEGSVQRSGDRVRVTAQLIDAIGGKHLWSERYDRDLKNIFELQDDLTVKIVSSLRIKLVLGEQAKLWEKNRPNNIKFNEKLFEAQFYGRQFTKEANVKAKQLYEEAIALEPGYFGAYAGLAYTTFMDVHLGVSKSPRESLDQAVKLCKKAITLDESQDLPHALLGHIYALNKTFDKAIAEGELAIALNPNSVGAYIYFGRTLAYAGHPEKAIDILKKAKRLDPLVGYHRLALGHAYREAGKYEEAITEYKNCIKMNQKNIFVYIGLTMSYALAGRYEEAREAWSEVLKIDPTGSTVEKNLKRWVYGPASRERILAALHKAGIKLNI